MKTVVKITLEEKERIILSDFYDMLHEVRLEMRNKDLECTEEYFEVQRAMDATEAIEELLCEKS